MPSPIALKKIAGLCLTSTLLFLMYSNMSFTSSQLNSQLKPQKNTTDLNMKNASLKPTEEILKRTHKLLPPIEVSLFNQNQDDQYSPSAPFTLQAKIRTLNPADAVDYEWVLPEGVTQLSGGNSSGPYGTFTHLSAHEEHTITATFISSSEINEKIYLRVIMHQNLNKMTQVAQYNTRDQKTLDAAMAELAKRNHEYLVEHTEVPKKSR